MHIESKNWFYILVIILSMTDLTILLNIPFLRQIFGFLFLTILPGLLILQILQLDKIDFLEKFILVWGISISFLMLFGLLLNNLLFNLSYETPLATLPLLIMLNIAFIVLAAIGSKINKTSIFSLPTLNLNTSEKAFLIVPVIFPALSIFGMLLMNTTDNNVLLMSLLFLIPIYVIFVCVFDHKFPKRLYPVVIFLISISLLLLLSLRSNHIIGRDAHLEYYFLKTTMNNLHWSVFGYSTLDACLAISLLPTIYQSILNIPSEFLFKILYSLLYSISPLVIYVISKKYVGEGYAFLASCFFMFQYLFLWTEHNARTSLAILFFALAMMTLFNDKIDPLKKRVLFIVFMASCMVSHYSSTYIFFFIMLGAFVGMEILSKKYSFKRVISFTMVILFLAFIFFWYSQVTEAAFNSGVRFIENTLSNLNKFFIEESRGSGVSTMLGKDISEKGIPQKIEFVFTWLTFALIGIGIITLIRRYKEMSFPELEFKKPDFLKDKFEVEYFVIALACAGLLVATVAVPHIASGYSLDRMYTEAIVILSVFFVIGGIMIARYSNQIIAVLRGKRFDEKNANAEVQAYLIILLVLIPYFLCVTGVMCNIFGVRRSIILNSEGKAYDIMYIQDQDSYAGKWFGKNYDEQQRIHVADGGGSRVMRSQAITRRSPINIGLLSEHAKIEGYIYLRYYNVVDGLVLGGGNMTEYSDMFIGKNRIYDNGGSEVWR